MPNSLDGRVALIIGGSGGIGAAKAGIDVMTKSLGRALAPEVRVLGIAPGVVETNFVPGRGADFIPPSPGPAPR